MLSQLFVAPDLKKNTIMDILNKHQLFLGILIPGMPRQTLLIEHCISEQNWGLLKKGLKVLKHKEIEGKCTIVALNALQEGMYLWDMIQRSTSVYA